MISNCICAVYHKIIIKQHHQGPEKERKSFPPSRELPFRMEGVRQQQKHQQPSRRLPDRFFSAVFCLWIFFFFFFFLCHRNPAVEQRNIAPSLSRPVVFSENEKHMKRIIVCVFIIECVVLRKRHPKSVSAWVGKLESEWERECVGGWNNRKKENSCSCHNSVVWTDRYGCRGNAYTAIREKAEKYFPRVWGEVSRVWVGGERMRKRTLRRRKQKRRKWNNNKTTSKSYQKILIWVRHMTRFLLLYNNVQPLLLSFQGMAI